MLPRIGGPKRISCDFNRLELETFSLSNSGCSGGRVRCNISDRSVPQPAVARPTRARARRAHGASANYFGTPSRPRPPEKFRLGLCRTGGVVMGVKLHMRFWGFDGG